MGDQLRMEAAGGQVVGDLGVTTVTGKVVRMIVAEVLGVVAGMEVVGVAEMEVVGVKVVGDGGAEVGVEMRLGVEIFVM